MRVAWRLPRMFRASRSAGAARYRRIAMGVGAAAGFVGAATGIGAAAAAAPGEPRVFCFGSAQYNQLGLGTGKNMEIPTHIPSLDAEQIEQISAGLHTTAAVTRSGEVYTWGRGQRLVLGHGDRSEVPYPRVVEALRDAHVSHVALSENVAAAVDKEGSVYTWGSRALGRQGKGNLPEKVDIKEIRSVSCGPAHVLAVDGEGRLYAWGEGYEGALGLGDSDDRKTPTVVESLGRVKQVSCGAAFSLVVTEDGKLYSFGAGDYGQTAQGGGVNASRYTRTPTLVNALQRHKITHVAAGVYHAACVTDEGKVFTWGYGKDGQCGHGDRAVHSPLPRQLQGLAGVKAVKVSCGDGHTAVLCDQGDLYVFGRGRDGQLGRGDQLESVASYRTKPRSVEFFKRQGMRVLQVALGGYHSVVLAK